MEGAWWAGFWLPLEIFKGGERQWATEGGERGSAEFPLWLLFFLACLAHCQGVCAELGLGPGRRQSQGGPSSLPAGRRCHGHFRDWQARGAGLSASSFLLANVLVPLVESWPHGPSAKAPEVPPARPTQSLFDSEQVICTLSLLFPCQQNGGIIGVKMGESGT